MQELTFLRSDPHLTGGDGEDFSEVYSLPEGDKWVGYGLCAGAPPDYEPLPGLPESPEEKEVEEKRVSRYFVTVFTPEKLISRVEIVTAARNPGIEYLEKERAIRFRRIDGWKLYLIEK